MTTRTWLPVAAAATTLLLWSSAFVAIRHLGTDVPPGALALGRLLVGAAVLGALVLRRRPTWPRGREWWLVVACGVGWFGVYNVALNAAERRIDAGTAALVVQVGPLVVTLLAAVLLGEPMTRWVGLGMAVGFVGVLVIARGSSTDGSGDLLGVGLAVVAALGFAVGVLTQKPLLRRVPALEVTFLACAVGALACLPFTGQLVEVARTAPASSLLWIGYLGLFPTALAFTTWAFALARTDAGRLSLTTFLVPFVATLLAWLLLAEVPPALAFVGGALAIAGVLLTRVRSRSTAGPGAEAASRPPASRGRP